MMTMLERDKMESVIEDIKIMSDYPWHHKLNYILEHDQAQRVVIGQLQKRNAILEEYQSIVNGIEKNLQKALDENEQQAKEIAASDELLKMNGIELTSLIEENKTLREALQACQNRLGCGCGDILCATCSAAYDLADKALKEVS